MNRLGNESSLYLRQHADNPVDWHPWDDDALRRARELDRPILLSIGYSACHWCHVMAHESFEDAATAEVMNRHFVNIKVDREERPDLDRIYQLAHQLLTGRGGGWPLTVFIDPERHIPFFAGTYFPKERRYGMPAFTEVLEQIAVWFREHRDEVGRDDDKLLQALHAIQQPRSGDGDPLDRSALESLIQAVAQQVYSRHDSVNGGFGGGPKFPQAPLLEAVAESGDLEPGGQLHTALEFSLEQMALSGLRDHLDGGFFRYCVDDAWTIPHFEKMLYDNALLLPLYAEGARRWNNPLLREAAEGIAAWLLATMRQPDGGYAASIDADADGEEGGFHVWRRDQIESVLDQEQAALICRAYGLDGPPNFENRSWHLQRARPRRNDPVQAFDDAASAVLEQARERLLAAREERVHPTLDSKRLTAWNALLADGFLRAGRALDRAEWIAEADRILEFIRTRLWRDGRLYAVFNAGEPRFAAYLDDHAWVLQAVLRRLQQDWSRSGLEFAIELAETLLARFEDPQHGGFFFSDATVDVPMARSMLFQDDATPAGNAAAARALDRLGRLLGETRYTEAAARCLARAVPSIREAPAAHTSFVGALRDAAVPPAQLVIAGADPAACERLRRWLKRYDRLDCYLLAPNDEDLPGNLGAYRTEQAVAAWLCRGMTCLPPVHTREELEELLGKPA
ncbi:MAG: thioredoxin domain-containing protein [Xanthomonadales bacterium]